MSEIANFREVNENEKKIISNSLYKVSSKMFKLLEENNYLLYISFNNLVEKVFPSIYLIPLAIVNNFESKNVKTNIISAGIYFGFIKKGEFMLSLEAVEFLISHNWISEEQKLYLTVEGEKSVLYGNRIVKKMIDEMPQRFNKDSLFFIFNNKKEFLAIGKSKINYEDFKNIKSNDVVAINLVDKGYYLRKSQ